MNIENESLKSYTKSLMERLFLILDLTNRATSEEDLLSIDRFISGLENEIRGSLPYYSDVKFGNRVPTVLFNISGIKGIPDYNVRRKAILDSNGILEKIFKSLED